MVRKIRLVEKTVEGIETEMEKARTLAEGCGALQGEFEDCWEEEKDEGCGEVKR